MKDEFYSIVKKSEDNIAQYTEDYESGQDYTGKEEETLVKLAQQGDTRIEEFLIKKYKSIVKGKANLYFMAGADRDDVVQEGMIGIFKAIRDYDETKGASFATFAELCINRQILSAIKRASRMKHLPLNSSISLNKSVSEEEHGETLAEILSSNCSTDPEAMVLLREDLDFIDKNGRNIFSALEWKVWTLYMQGKTYMEIADIMERNPKTIDNAIQRAKKKLELFLSQ